jgi:hypothetical protein
VAKGIRSPHLLLEDLWEPPSPAWLKCGVQLYTFGFSDHHGPKGNARPCLTMRAKLGRSAEGIGVASKGPELGGVCSGPGYRVGAAREKLERC